MEYTKPALTHDEQLKRYEELGLNVGNKKSAISALSFIGHFRLSPYLKYYREQKDAEKSAQFKSDTSFENVLKLYYFDSCLRNLALSKIEKIEIGLKALISEVLSLKLTPFWYTQQNIFVKDEVNRHIREKINEQRESSIILKHFYSKYHLSSLPPSWMMMELISFGTLDRIFKNLHRKYSKLIADRLDTSPEVLTTWLRALSVLRNFCAHHHRIWNRIFPFRPMQPIKFKTTAQHLDIDKFFVRAQIMNFILIKIDPVDDWKNKLMKLFNDNSHYPLTEMGLMINVNEFTWWG